MSFTATFYTFQKKINSTKQPSSGTDYSIILKDGCSTAAPTISLDLGLDNSPASYNYCYIPAFNRYYWITEWVFDNRLWTARCRVDSLASFKSQIGATSCYIARSASAYDTKIVDDLYPALAKNTHLANTVSSPFDKTGSYVVGIQGKGAGGNGGAVTYYAGSSAAIKALVNYMLSSPSSYQVSEISEELLMCVFNPLQYIVSCMWFPFSVPTMGGSVTCGWWDVSGSGLAQVSSLEWGSNMSISIPKHPKAASRGSYLNLPPFAKYRLEAGQWGVIPLDAFNLLDSSSLTLDWKVDLMTGSGRLNIQFRDRIIYDSVYTAQIGVPVQLGQNMFNQGALTGAGGGIINTIKSAVSGDPAGMLQHGLSSIGNAAALTQSIPSMVGSNGTISFNNIFGIMGDFLDIADEDITGRGRPLCQVRTISGLSGYIQCYDADPSVNCSDSELSEIVSYMNNGFFYE